MRSTAFASRIDRLAKRALLLALLLLAARSALAAEDERRPAHVAPARITLAIRAAKASSLRDAQGNGTRVETTVSIHNSGPADAMFPGGECGLSWTDLLQLFAVDVAGKEWEIPPEPVLDLCLGGAEGFPRARLPRGKTWSARAVWIYFATTPGGLLKPGKYRLVLRYRGDGDPIIAAWMWHGYAESKPVEVIVPEAKRE